MRPERFARHASTRAVRPLRWSPEEGVLYESEVRENQSGMGPEVFVSVTLSIDGRPVVHRSVGLSFGETTDEIEQHAKNLAKNDWALRKGEHRSMLRQERIRRGMWFEHTADIDPVLDDLSRAQADVTSARPLSAQWERASYDLRTVLRRVVDEGYTKAEIDSAIADGKRRGSARRALPAANRPRRR